MPKNTPAAVARTTYARKASSQRDSGPALDMNGERSNRPIGYAASRCLARDVDCRAMLDHGEPEKNKARENEIGRPDPEAATDQKATDVNSSTIVKLLQQKSTDQEAAEHEEQIHARWTEIMKIGKCWSPRASFPRLHDGVREQHEKNRDAPQNVELQHSRSIVTQLLRCRHHGATMLPTRPRAR